MVFFLVEQVIGNLFFVYCHVLVATLVGWRASIARVGFKHVCERLAAALFCIFADQCWSLNARLGETLG